jgi:hypothetical protein
MPSNKFILFRYLNNKRIAELPYLFCEFVTHSPRRLSFEGHDRGKWIYIAARWENTRGVKGPRTEIINAVVSPEIQ